MNVIYIWFFFVLEYSFDEIERILLLLFACSVSGGDKKDLHIQNLTRLNESIQQFLMPHIEELTNEINKLNWNWKAISYFQKKFIHFWKICKFYRTEISSKFSSI